MKGKTLFICLVLVSALIIGITIAVISEDLFKKEANTKEKEQETNVSWVIVNEDPLLGKYEKSDRAFKKSVSNRTITYVHERKIDGVEVTEDRIAYVFDKNTKKLIRKYVKWRDDLPEHLPPVPLISKEEAESIAKSEAKGKIMNTSLAHTRLCYISSNDSWYPLEPPPKNPCWIVYFADDEGYNTDVIIIDAVEGKILGHGVPFP